MNKMIVPIRGMRCRSCEMLIEDNLKQITGVRSVRVNYKKNVAEVLYESQRPDVREIDGAIRKAGYSIGQPEKKAFFTKNPSDYKDLGIAFLFLVGIYLVLKNLGLTNIQVGSSASPSSLPVVFLVGITAGVSTCMALVGGLVLGISGRHAEQHPEATPMQKFRPHLFFNIGRIVSYAFLGGVLGYLGSVLNVSNFALGILTIVVGVVMLVLGLQLTEMFPWLGSWKLTLPKGISRILGIKDHQKEYSHRGAAIMGALTFFLPCGFTQAMQLYAISTGSFAAGSLTMGVFALGTAPGLLGIGGLTSVVRGIFARRFFKMAGMVVVFLSFFNVANGYRLSGMELSSPLAFLGESLNSTDGKAAVVASDPNVTVENGVQIVRMTESSRGYSPNKFTIQKGIPVRWVIEAKDPYSCASSIAMSKYNIRKSLKKGENIIEFTPTETGRLPFSCSMGMYTGSFTVVDENGSGAVSDNSNPDVKTPQAAGGGGCGGGAKAPANNAGGCGGSGGGCGGCGGGKPVTPSEGKTIESTDNASPEKPAAETNSSKVQLIKTAYTYDDDIQPNTFTVKAGAPVRIEVDVKENGYGCMSTIMIPDLYDTPELLQKGSRIVMEFTPTKKGEFPITCAMGVPRGVVNVI